MKLRVKVAARRRSTKTIVSGSQAFKAPNNRATIYILLAHFKKPIVYFKVKSIIGNKLLNEKFKVEFQ